MIRGAKLHITGASFGHELLTIPTKAMKAGEEDWSGWPSSLPRPTAQPASVTSRRRSPR
ncbi:hypothetical protein [Candidatus Poriferisodalis sp.]|uniref:hypothetical protein n=1 Tax=Candidatus Poriferisodalis sp. TaxID=3101277 RepID=UPI003B014CD2